MLCCRIWKWLSKESTDADAGWHLLWYAIIVAALFFPPVWLVIAAILAIDLGLLLLRAILWFLASGVLTAKSFFKRSPRACPAPPLPKPPCKKKLIADLRAEHEEKLAILPGLIRDEEHLERAKTELERTYHDRLQQLMRS